MRTMLESGARSRNSSSTRSAPSTSFARWRTRARRIVVRASPGSSSYARSMAADASSIRPVRTRSRASPRCAAASSSCPRTSRCIAADAASLSCSAASRSAARWNPAPGGSISVSTISSRCTTAPSTSPVWINRDASTCLASTFDGSASLHRRAASSAFSSSRANTASFAARAATPASRVSLATSRYCSSESGTSPRWLASSPTSSL